MLAQIRFELLQKWFARGAIVRALFRKGMNAPEIVATDEKIARETAAIIQRIARRLSQLERFALTLRHFRSVDDGRGGLPRLDAGLFGGLFFRCFERRLHNTWFRRARAFPKVRTAQTSHRSASAVPSHREFTSNRH